MSTLFFPLASLSQCQTPLELQDIEEIRQANKGERRCLHSLIFLTTCLVLIRKWIDRWTTI